MAENYMPLEQEAEAFGEKTPAPKYNKPHSPSSAGDGADQDEDFQDSD